MPTTPTGGHFEALEIHRKGRSAGSDVWPQVTCRPLSFSIALAEARGVDRLDVVLDLE